MRDGSDPGYIRPWSVSHVPPLFLRLTYHRVWILWLFLGPVFGSIAIQWYIFVAVSINAPS